MEKKFIELGQFIKKTRESKKISAYSIEKEFGFSRNRWSRIENGKEKNMPTFATLNQIAQILEINVSELYIAAGYLSDEDVEYIKEKK